MTDERARQGIEHLQAAGVEVIAALRAFLDVAEAIVRDPNAGAVLAASVVDAVRPAAGPAPAEGVDPEPRVTRIRVS